MSNVVSEAWGSATNYQRGTLSFEVYNNVFGGGDADAPYPLYYKGGTGVLFNNTIQGSCFGFPYFRLGDYRIESHYQVITGGYYWMSMCDGLSPIDGNLPADATATGVHTGSDDSDTLVCAGKTWTPNQWAGYAVRNKSDPECAGYIISNTADTLTTCTVMIFSTAGYINCTSSDPDREVSISGLGNVGPLKSFVSKKIGSSSSRYQKISWYVQTSGAIPSTGTASISGGSGSGTYLAVKKLGFGGKNHWDNGDSFVITDGYPGLDQLGRSPGTELVNGTTVQKSEPVYEWNNNLDGVPTHLDVDNGTETHIKENRDFYNLDKTALGYTPYTYPHPLTLMDVVDTSSPIAPSAVRDGTGSSDIDFIYSSTTLSANWNAGSDNESGISGYQYAIGTAPGSTNVLAYQSVGLPSVIRAGLNLTTGATYYFSVRSVNGVGLVSTGTAVSNGQYVTADGTPPAAPGIVRDGAVAGVDISTTSLTTQLSANWTQGSDSESGISGYKYAIGTTAGASDTAGWATLGNVLTATKTSLALSAGTTYYFSVKSVNGAGLESAAANSNGVVVISTTVVDTSSPTAPGVVRDGATGGADISSTQNTGVLSANWTQGSDPESGVTSYQYAIGTTAGGVNTAGWASVGNILAVTRSGLSLSNGTTYYFSVKAVNAFGLVGPSANSNGQYVVAIDTGDITPPANIAVVRDGTGADESAAASTTQLSANWDTSADAESGIARYWYAIGTQPGASDTQIWTDNGQSTSLTAIGLTLIVGVTYYVSVVAENGVGLESSTTTSSGQYAAAPPPPDTTGPVISGVFAQGITTGGAAIIWTTDEASTSQVEYGKTTGYGKASIEDISLTLNHNAVLTGLTANTLYHFRVISIDASTNETVSADYTFTTLPETQQISETIHAYPNPYNLSNGSSMKFRAAGAVSSEVSIYTISGRLIKKLSSEAGAGEEIGWDGTNTDNQKVSRGIYIYKITTSSGGTITGKIALTK
ncbi:MAG: hypothetical protein A2297_00200 [Elusimicrobia bacterium RIFOXYB2_FULL_48_7]|nr:MAG: hypothetical protein A2297_00200 [Elusimicrobia bacterium RIFOXYB2_FULL_48_7]